MFHSYDELKNVKTEFGSLGQNYGVLGRTWEEGSLIPF
jgi:hypothetical protein